MDKFNYFNILCFIWAFVGIASRFLMIHFKERWNKWELEKAYSEEKPKWIYVVAVFSLIIVGYTWYKVIVLNVKYSWIISSFITLTLIKVFMLIFHYQKFREFVKEVLNNKRKLMQLNIGVFIFSIICILMGIYLY